MTTDSEWEKWSKVTHHQAGAGFGSRQLRRQRRNGRMLGGAEVLGVVLILIGVIWGALQVYGWFNGESVSLHALWPPFLIAVVGLAFFGLALDARGGK